MSAIGDFAEYQPFSARKGCDKRSELGKTPLAAAKHYTKTYVFRRWQRILPSISYLAYPTVYSYRLGNKPCHPISEAIQIFAETVVGGIHLPQTFQDLFGAGIVMHCNMSLPVFYQRLYGRRTGVLIHSSGKGRKDGICLGPDCRLFFRVTAG